MNNYLHPSTDIPADIFPPETWPEFGRIAMPASICSREEVLGGGIRWGLWPLTFEDYVGDTEPDLSNAATGTLNRNRMVYWRRVHRGDVPPGWKQSSHPWRVDGYFRLSHGDYTQQWAPDAQRNVLVWRKLLQANSHTVTPLSMAEFSYAYKKSGAKKAVGTELLECLQRQSKLPDTAPHVSLHGIRHAGEIIAGVALLFSPSSNASIRICPFILDEGRKARAGTALMDIWFQQSQQKGVSTLISTHYWQPGEPKDWKGFSEFKSHFGFSYVAYPPALSRFVRGKIF